MDQPSWSRWLGSVQVVLSSKFTSLQLKRTKPNQHRTACLFGMTWHLKGGKYQISNRTAEEQQDIREKRTNRTTQVNSAPPSHPQLRILHNKMASRSQNTILPSTMESSDD